MANEESWTKRLQLVGQWIVIVLAIIVGWISLDRRVTILEASSTQEQKGYNIALENINKTLEYMRTKIDILVDKSHTHN